MRTWLVTGASRGIGRAIVEQALERGDTVVATVRNAAALPPRERLEVHTLDVIDTAALRAVVDTVFAAHRVDVVVSNAGSGVFGTAEDLSDAQVATMIDVNLVASIQLARAVVPHLREQGGGALMQLSSMGGQMTFPAFGLYHAAKWGIEGFFGSLAEEVKAFGITTTLVEPGMVRTGFFDAAPRVEPSPPYRGGPADRAPVAVEDMPVDEELVAAEIIRAADMADPPRRMLLGSDAYELVTAALAERLAEAEAQKDTAARADRPLRRD
ncbi:SDR family oxidoreductase [Pseudonocardia xishanensis]|uniref:SDR family oxidoreductase n=1 Tax=Pseudonocardia xishanensis TaxID=630995 RepID=UPI0031E5035A